MLLCEVCSPGQFQDGYAQGLGLVRFADGGHDQPRSEGNKTPSV